MEKSAKRYSSRDSRLLMLTVEDRIGAMFSASAAMSNFCIGSDALGVIGQIGWYGSPASGIFCK